jgi:uncharacterized protein
MSLQLSIKADMIAAMKAREAVKLSVIRGIMSAFTNELVNKGRTPTDTLSEDECTAVVKRLAKQRKDSIDQFTSGGRPDLAEGEKVELVILEAYLPAMASREAIEVKAKEILAGEEVIDKSKVGILVGKVVKSFNGTADGALVKEVVEALIA